MSSMAEANAPKKKKNLKAVNKWRCHTHPA